MHSRFFTTLCFVIVFTHSTVASAQQRQDQTAAAELLFYLFVGGALSTSSIPLTVTAAVKQPTTPEATVSSPFELISSSKNCNFYFRGGGLRCESARYIQHNAVGLRQEIALGAGEHITDLAQLHDVKTKDFPRFAQLLRKKRRAFSHLLRPDAPTRDIESAARQVMLVAHQARTSRRKNTGLLNLFE